MPVYTDDALILRTYKLGEADRIVVFLTKERGKKRGVAKGARRARSRFVGTLEPLTRAGVAYYEREQRDLVRINYVEPQQSPLAAVGREGQDAAALGHAEYFAELIDEWAPESHTDERLYRLGASVIDALASNAPVGPLARYFEFWLLRLQGVYPSLARCPDCGGAFDGGAVMPPREHHFVCGRCGPASGGTRVSISALQFLRTAAAASPEGLAGAPLESAASRELETAHRRLIAVHLEKELKSARVLREIARTT
ncbi:MAG TPA: DNA repair protein RecO [Vicinamibacterales bacterium]|jgi:DNA repair protein RecO (recombination protein O)|nr:DNA repair protein RecO [Vicinamibacterales bacterium]